MSHVPECPWSIPTRQLPATRYRRPSPHGCQWNLRDHRWAPLHPHQGGRAFPKRSPRWARWRPCRSRKWLWVPNQPRQSQRVRAGHPSSKGWRKNNVKLDLLRISGLKLFATWPLHCWAARQKSQETCSKRWRWGGKEWKAQLLGY